MKHISDSIRSYSKAKIPSSERAYTIQRICDSLFQQKDFKKILGQTKHFTIDEIKEIFDKAKNWRTNPRALFWKLVKKKNEEIKKEITEAEITDEPFEEN